MAEFCLQEFENFLHSQIQTRQPPRGVTASYWEEILSYPFESGGKRFRAQLAFSVGEAFDLSVEERYRIGAAIEVLHTASLIHDDLPEIDNDDFRRGRLSTHKKYGEGLAVVCADELFFIAPRILISLNSLSLIDAFLQTAEDLARGEAFDILYEKGKAQLQIQEIIEMYEWKTARLIQFSMTAPAIYKMSDKSQLDVLQQASKKIGIAFQVYDDIKDETGHFNELGKTPRKDSQAGKITVLTSMSIQQARQFADGLWKEAIEILNRTFSERISASSRFLNRIWEQIQSS